MKITKTWFTLIEVLLWILIFSIVILWWFQALSAVNIGKVKLMEKANITKDVVYFTEKLFEEIKTWWVIDYEEYFNRKVIWLTTQNGHYSQPTGFWNFWYLWTIATTNYGNNFYYCRSGDGINMWTWWCYGNLFNTTATLQNGHQQRYWQYAFQFIDYNGNMNADGWDENGNGNIRWDDDDEHLWSGPIVFTWWENVNEIYLISWDGKKRTFLRWTWRQDPNKPDVIPACGTTTFWSWCLWTIEILKLDWKDWGIDHRLVPTSAWSFDGIIDTWLIDEKFWTGAWIIAGSNDFNYWQPLFPDTVNVSDFQVYLYPNTNIKHAWKDKDPSSNINPYLRLSITLEPSWKKRVWMRWEVPKYTINTTINLVDYFTQ